MCPSSQDARPRGTARPPLILPTENVNLQAMSVLAADLDLLLEFHGEHAPFRATATEHTAHGDWLEARCLAAYCSSDP